MKYVISDGEASIRIQGRFVGEHTNPDARDQHNSLVPYVTQM